MELGIEQSEFDSIADDCRGVMIEHVRRILIWTEAELIGLAEAFGLSRILTEVDECGAVTRELGFDAAGNVIHRHPGQPTRAKYGVFDLANMASSGEPEMAMSDFDRLWAA